MYKIDLTNKTLHKIDSTILKDENLLERADLQQYIINSWESFKNDIGLPTTILIGEEIKPHDSVGDAIDLLAFDQDDSSLIVIELKRDKNKLQLLQALSYAAMVATWDSEKLISIVNRNNTTNSINEAMELIKNSELNNEVKIVLISEYYDPEVIITANWLSSQYGLKIYAYSISLHKIEKQLLLEIDQKFPLPELSDTYEARRKVSTEINSSGISWEQVIPNLKYDFAEKGIEIFKKIKPGEPNRRRFGSILTNYEGFNWITVFLREKYMNIYTQCNDKQLSKQKIADIFGEEMPISEWEKGISFNISDINNFNKLLKWLKL